MNSIIKMFGPALSGPARLVNRDVPACDELAYKAAGYQRGSIPEPVEAEPIAEAPAEIKLEFVKVPKPRKVVSK